MDEFTTQALQTGLWCDLYDPDNPEEMGGGEGLYDDSDLTPESLARLIEECASFQADAGELIEGREGQAGHDFWLTRNGHGTGFLERPEIYGPTTAFRLDKVAESFGEAYAIYE